MGCLKVPEEPRPRTFSTQVVPVSTTKLSRRTPRILDFSNLTLGLRDHKTCTGLRSSTPKRWPWRMEGTLILTFVWLASTIFTDLVEHGRVEEKKHPQLSAAKP